MFIQNDGLGLAPHHSTQQQSKPTTFWRTICRLAPVGFDPSQVSGVRPCISFLFFFFTNCLVNCLLAFLLFRELYFCFCAIFLRCLRFCDFDIRELFTVGCVGCV